MQNDFIDKAEYRVNASGQSNLANRYNIFGHFITQARFVTKNLPWLQGSANWSLKYQSADIMNDVANSLQ